MSEETERLKLELALLLAREKEQARLARIAAAQAREAHFAAVVEQRERFEATRAEARAKREARFEAAEQRRLDKAIARTPEGKKAIKQVNLEQWTADRIAEGWRYVTAWGHTGQITMLKEPPVPLACRDRVTPELTDVERAMTHDDFMEAHWPGWKAAAQQK